MSAEEEAVLCRVAMCAIVFKCPHPRNATTPAELRIAATKFTGAHHVVAAVNPVDASSAVRTRAAARGNFCVHEVLFAYVLFAPVLSAIATAHRTARFIMYCEGKQVVALDESPRVQATRSGTHVADKVGLVIR